jgi:hypothetical protein
MASDDVAKRDWIALVLGVTLPGATASDAAAGPSGTAAVADMPRRWREAQERVRAALARIVASLLTHPGVQADSRFSQVKAAAAKLPSLVPEFAGKFESVVNNVVKAGGISPALAEQGKSALAEYQGALARVPALSQLESFAAKHLKLDVKLFTDLEETLIALLAEFARSGATGATGS